MTEFLASNGVKVSLVGLSAKVTVPGDSYAATLNPAALGGLAEWFMRQRDIELGRWRSKEHPEYVVYRRETDAYVLNESHGGGWQRLRGTSGGDIASRVAREFFAAHPEPKPWHDAKPGQVWLVTADAVEEPMICVGVEYGADFIGRDTQRSIVAPSITAGRRIWPAVV